MGTSLKILLLVFVISVNMDSFGQNLVPNPSFEDYSICPNSTGQLAYTGNWNFVGASTDYYNACSPQGAMSTPSNIYGFQDAVDSNAYIGMIVYAIGDYQQENTFREPAGTQLTEPLTIGETYYLSFKASLTINSFESGGACNKIGAKLSTVSYSNSNPVPVDNFAHVWTDSVLTDSVGWTTISGSFVADSAYSFISIGNFFDSTNIQYVDYNGLWFTETAYYYIDDIRLSTDSMFVNSVDEITLNNVSMYPNPTSDYVNLDFIDNQNHDVIIYNSIGEVVLRKVIIQKGSIDVSSLTKGIYCVAINQDKYRIIKKLIIN